MLKSYFKLQLEMMNRRLREAGFNPILGFILLAIGFVVISFYLFHKTADLAGYIYSFIALVLVGNLSEKKRTDFLNMCFKDQQWMKVRLIENLIIVLPFVAILCYQYVFLVALLLIALTALLSIVTFRTRGSITIPTPFSKRPFEFLVGFRTTFYLFIPIYILTLIAVKVDNFNLGIFSLLLIFAVNMGYYTKPEDEYYVWSYNRTPKQFLLQKIKTALIFSSLLSLPIVLTLGIVYYTEIVYTAFFLVMGYSFLVCTILAKYSVYPIEMNLVEGILIAFSLAFPPLLLIIVPYFYTKSIKSLNNLLE